MVNKQPTTTELITTGLIDYIMAQAPTMQRNNVAVLVQVLVPACNYNIANEGTATLLRPYARETHNILLYNDCTSILTGGSYAQ